MIEHLAEKIERLGPATVYRDFLERSAFEQIQSGFMGPSVPWSYNKSIVASEEGSPDSFQFTHTVFSNAQITSPPGFEIIAPLIEKIKPAIILRIKANLGPRNNEHIVGGFHVDTNEICTTSVFYLNTNNGYTMLEDGTKLPSIENTLVTFDSCIKHTGVGQTDKQVRVVLNLNYIPED
jgi:hypothetical protein